eukprot:4413076-Pyramimonas_sp.AAC.1
MPNALLCRSSFRGCLRRGPGFSASREGRLRAQIGMVSQAVCLFGCPISFSVGEVSEDVSYEALVSAFPRGGARGYITGPFAPRLGWCLRRFAGLGS